MSEKTAMRTTGRVLMLAFYVIFIIAYLGAGISFGVYYKNVWSAFSYACVAPLIGIRIFLYVTPKPRLLALFPPCSVQRALYQSFFLVLSLVSLVIALCLLGVALKRRETWDGKSLFCSMVGFSMLCKWCWFIMMPMYHLRWDVVDPELLYRAKAAQIEDGEDYVKLQMNPMSFMRL